MSRRELFVSGRRGVGLVLFGGGASAVLAACATQEPAVTGPTEEPTPTPGEGEGQGEDSAAPEVEGTAIVDDVIDFALESDDWAGPFGFVTFRMHRALADGNDVYYIRTDASDAEYAREHGLVSVPKIGVLAEEGLVVKAYFPAEDAEGDQPTLVSSEPGRDDYTSAWQVHRYRWIGEVGEVTSVEELEAAVAEGGVEVEETDVVLNASAVQWAGGSLPVDEEFTEYLGAGQLVEAPDTDAMTVTFKLHECYPNVRYIVTDTALAPMAEGMAVAHTPALAGSSQAGATGRTNVFMNGIQGPGPMGFQPSVFDTQAGDPEWSPYWDHMTYAWADDVEPRVLETEEDVHAARDAGELEEFPGTPDTDGQTFVVNCPVPVLADNTFQA